MRQAIVALSVIVFWLAAETRAFAYASTTYGGHYYILTHDYGTWQDAENEAVAAGGYLATINTSGENAWLTQFIKDVRLRNQPDYTGGNLAWIGAVRTGADASDPSSWTWTTGEKANETFWNPYQLPGVFNPNGVYMFLMGANHPAGPGEWNGDSIGGTANPLGIIEVPVLSYGGHRYLLTQSCSTWQEAENEAVAAGGHLATINTQEENDVLTAFIRGIRLRSQPDYTGGNLAWIGAVRTGADASDPASWTWRTGEKASETFWNPYQLPGVFNPNGTYMFLMGADHPEGPGEWNGDSVGGTHSQYDANPFGIIEIPAPEPSTFALLGACAVGLALCGWRKRRVA